MAEVQHGTLRPGVASGNHVIHDWEVADAAARLALVVVELQVGKVCRQLSDNSFWILRRFTGGVLWERIDNEASGPALSNAMPAPIGTAAPGTANDASRGDHAHAHGDQAGGSLHAIATGAVAGFLSASDKAKLDGIPPTAGTPPAAPVSPPPAIAAAGATGTPGTYATSSHTHAHGDQAGGTTHAVAVAGGAAGFLSGADKAKLDGIPATAAALTSTPPVNVTKSAAATGVATDGARADHKHDVTTAAPVSVGAANAEGASSSLARADHVHAHGDQAGGTLHAVAVAGGAAGFLSGSDKTKLDGLTAPPAAPGAPPPDIAAAGATGAPGSYATSSHTHGHGAQAGGTTHATAIAGGAAGFLSGTDKAKLDLLSTSFNIVSWATTALTIAATHADALIVWTGVANATFTIPSDAMVSLPIGFTCSLYHGASDSFSISINDAAITLSNVFGCSASDGLPGAGLATFVKIAANTWITNGTYGSTGPA